MAKQKPVHQVRRPGLRIRVYPNRVEIVKTRGCFLLSKTERIPFRNIATATHAPGTETLVIQTNDGKTRKYRLGGFGGAARGVADAIMENI